MISVPGEKATKHPRLDKFVDRTVEVPSATIDQYCCRAVSYALGGREQDFFDTQIDAGYRPEQFAHIWVHTNPGDCPQPSMTDEETFDRVFGVSFARWADRKRPSEAATVRCRRDC